MPPWRIIRVRHRLITMAVMYVCNLRKSNVSPRLMLCEKQHQWRYVWPDDNLNDID